MNNERLVKLVGMCSLFILLSFYFFLNRRIKEAKLIHTALDDKIPFVAWLVIPYLFFYVPLLYGSIFLSYFQSLKNFYEFSFSLMIVLSESFLTFILYPTKVKEHEITTTSIWNSLVSMVYVYDKRVNAFPSIHVGVSIVCSYFLSFWYPALVLFFVLIAISIIVSTVTLKQHSILDILGGFVTGISSIMLGKLLLFNVERYLWI